MVFEGLDLQAMMEGLEKTGFYEVVLPFLLIFTVVFAVLQKVRLFGKDSQKYNLIIALVMGFLVIRMTPIVQNINLFLPKVSWIVLVFIMTLMLLGIFGAKAEGFTGVPFFVAVVISIVGILWALSPTAKLPEWLQLTPQDKWTLVGIGVFVLIIYFITKEGGGMKSVRKGLEDMPGHFGRRGGED